jgi:hypothetical protein
MLLEALDAEELCAQHLAIVPGRNGRAPPRDTRDEIVQCDRGSALSHGHLESA